MIEIIIPHADLYLGQYLQLTSTGTVGSGRDVFSVVGMVVVTRGVGEAGV